jgi:two-component system, NtrC family, sensor kinase
MSNVIFFLRNCLAFVLLLLAQSTFAGRTIVFRDTLENMEIGKSISILEDTNNSLTIQDVLRSTGFRENHERVPIFGLTNSAFWIRFTVKNETAGSQLLLMLEEPIMDETELYYLLPDGQYSVTRLGEFKPFSERKYKDPNYIFDLNLPSGETRTYYLKVHSSENVQVPLLLGTPQSVFESIKPRDVLSGIYFGIMLVMILYNLFIFFTVKDRSYLYYVIYIVIILLTQTSTQGYPFQYLWPYSPWIARHSLFLFPSLVGIAGIEFLKSFLHAREYFPKWVAFARYLYILYGISITLALCQVYALSYNLMEVTAMCVSLYMLFLAIKIYRKGYRPAKFFLIGWTIFLLGVCIYIIKDFGVLPYNNFTRYTMQIGSGIEVILLSFGLADRINALKKEKEESQARALEVLHENERIIREQNILLEAKVRERTEALEISNKDLSVALSNLKDTQMQLVDAEKMASLGQLTAGIAHEINNPINFVISNVKPLRRDIEDILSLVDKYGDIKPDETLDSKLKEIESYKEELDLSYLMEEINSLLKGIDEGASRTSEIVKGLKNFSRLDESDLKKTNIHEGLDSTLTLLNNQLRDRIQVVKEYGNLPQIECYPGKLNQVFMNILTNAIQAIQSRKPAPMEGRITITTINEADLIKISIRDNGIGIPDEALNKIFDPFFTTKNVGEGTGLGLSIAYSIIEKHRGKIRVNSQKGMGTEFIVILPKNITPSA